MKSLLYKLFIQDWPRKLLAIILAAIIWLVVNHSLTATRTISNIPVRLLNIPVGKTIEGLQPNGRLTKKLTLTLVGNKTLLEELTPYDIEIVLDAQGRPDEWIATVSKKNLVSLNPEIDVAKGITRVYHPNFLVRMTKVVTDQIPVIITQPIGEAPRGYALLDVWPYRLMLTITGPEDMVKQLQRKEQRLTFNLNDISKSDLDAAARKSNEINSDVVSYFVPDQWKQLNIPSISDKPIDINDPQAKALRIDFVRCSLLSLEAPIPVELYFPPDFAPKYNPDIIKLAHDGLIQNRNGVNLINPPLFANGADRLFLETVQNMMQIVIIVNPTSDKETLEWSLQFINPRQLENDYVAAIMSDVSDTDIRLLQPALREEYLRNRFRSYMNRLQLYSSDQNKLELVAYLKDQLVHVEQAQVGTTLPFSE